MLALSISAMYDSALVAIGLPIEMRGISVGHSICNALNKRDNVGDPGTSTVSQIFTLWDDTLTSVVEAEVESTRMKVDFPVVGNES